MPLSDHGKELAAMAGVGAVITLGKLLAGGKHVSAWVALGRMIVGAGLSTSAEAVLLIFDD